MTYCTSCGRSSPDDVRFCAHCGVALAKPVLGFDTPLAPAAAQCRPVGRTQDPALVIVLIIVTLGIYSLVWWWRISRESDAYAGTPGHAHSPTRAGVVVTAISIVLMIVAVVAIVGAVMSTLTPEMIESGEVDSEALTMEALAGMGAAALVFLLAVVVSLVGTVLLLIGRWRVWRVIEESERARGLSAPLSPMLLLVLVLIPTVGSLVSWLPVLNVVVPIAGLVAMAFAYHRTQRGLNEMWAASASAPEPPENAAFAFAKR